VAGFEETLSKIKERGYWWIVMHPTHRAATPRQLPDIERILRDSVVSLTGWDHPHVPFGTDENGGCHRLNEAVEAWADFHIHKQVLRFFTNGLFVHLLGFREDWYADDPWPTGLQSVKPGTALDFLGVIYEVTQMMIFLRNLVQREVYPEGVVFNLELRGTKGRELTTFEPGRYLSREYRAHSEVIQPGSQILSAQQVLEGHLALATKSIQAIFHRFGSDRISDDLIEQEQKKLIDRRL
jgi:hypothetical protein